MDEKTRYAMDNYPEMFKHHEDSIFNKLKPTTPMEALSRTMSKAPHKCMEHLKFTGTDTVLNFYECTVCGEKYEFEES